jgi:hypothetical protein
MNSATGGLILVFGIIILIAGIAMPATTTQTSTSCYDNPVGFGQECVETTYEAPNTGRGWLIGTGALVSVIGGILALSGDSTRRSRNISSEISDGTSTRRSRNISRSSDDASTHRSRNISNSSNESQSLAEEVRKRRSKNNEEKDDSDY